VQSKQNYIEYIYMTIVKMHIPTILHKKRQNIKVK